MKSGFSCVAACRLFERIITRNEKVVSSILTTSSREKDHREKYLTFPGDLFIAANCRRLFSVIFGADKVADIRTLSGQYLVIEILFPVDICNAVLKLLDRLAQPLLLFSRHFLSWDNGRFSGKAKLEIFLSYPP